jgi:hypothetical protein
VSEVPGRQEEAMQIFDFLALSENGTTTPLCLHGNTGCGKTSLITKVMAFFQENFRTVKVAYINCMSMWSATHVYTGILSTLFGVTEKKRTAGQALAQQLEGKRGKGEPTKMIILDEIDQFMNDQHFMYNMLEWLTCGSKLVLVLISNVIDLTLRLEGKLQSRMKFQTLIFKPYSYQQIEKIIEYKYPHIRTMMQKEAVTFVAKKIFNINSDIRLLEKIYARIENEFKRNDGRTLVNLQAVNGLVYEENKLPVMLAPYADIIKILYRAASAKENNKKKEISQEIRHKLFLHGTHFPQSKEVLLILTELQDSGLITLTSRSKNCDMTYYDYGIKVHESLSLLYADHDH